MNSPHSTRLILHIDMNAFYCACHAAHEPERFHGVATAVAGSPETRHGVVVTASYEARAKGVRATMTVAEALRHCRNLILIYPDFHLYRSYSARVFALVRQYTPLVEVFSIDECFADVTGSSQFGSAYDIATKIQSRLLKELGLPCSIGMGPNKFLAKMASDMKKPLGITQLWTSDVSRILWPLPVADMFGVGTQTAKRLKNLCIETIGELAQADIAQLRRSFGKRGEQLLQWANGIDNQPVNPEPEPLKSVGHSITLSVDISSPDEINTVLLNLADQVGRRVRKHQLVGKTVQVTIRFQSMKTITRAHTLREATDLTEVIYEHAQTLVFQQLQPRQKVRLLGVTLGQLMQETTPQRNTQALKEVAGPTTSVQLTLFDIDAGAQASVEPPPKRTNIELLRKLTQVTDELRNRFGEDIVIRGRMMRPHESNEIRNRKVRGTSLQKDNIPSD